MKVFLATAFPLIVYVSIEAIFDFKTAIILTIIYGIIEFSYFYIKDKRIDKLILISTILIIFTGGISVYFESPELFKLKPAILQIFTVLFLLYFIIKDISIMSLMKDRLPENAKNIGLDQEIFIKKVTRDMTIILFLHSGLIVYSAYKMSTASWLFISGFLPYILIIGLIIIEAFIFRKKMVRESLSDENITIESTKKKSIRERS